MTNEFWPIPFISLFFPSIYTHTAACASGLNLENFSYQMCFIFFIFGGFLFVQVLISSGNNILDCSSSLDSSYVVMYLLFSRQIRFIINNLLYKMGTHFSLSPCRCASLCSTPLLPPHRPLPSSLSFALIFLVLCSQYGEWLSSFSPHFRACVKLVQSLNRERVWKNAKKKKKKYKHHSQSDPEWRKKVLLYVPDKHTHKRRGVESKMYCYFHS